MQRIVYLDHAAATPVDQRVVAAMLPYYTEKFYNPSATYLAAKEVRKDLDTARGEIAAILGAKSSETIFTAGGTEANNLAVHGVMRQYPGAKVLVSAIEHESVLEPAKQYNHEVVSVNELGEVDAANIAEQIDDSTVLVSVMYANNEIGTVQPIRALAAQIEEIRKQRRDRGITLPIFLHTDACQAANYLDMHVARLGVDIMTINGGKIYGPKQSGALFVSSRTLLVPLLQGGGQERNLRSGTENIAQAVGLARALQHVSEARHEEVARMQSLQKTFFEALQKAIPQVVINGSRSRRLPNNVHITIPGQDNERLIFGLDNRGVMAAAGSACSASSDEPSHVLRALGKSETEAQSSLRFTMGAETSKDDVLYTVQTLADILG